MPLVWAHAEFIKLARSYESGRPFDRPEAVWQRYQGHRPQARYTFWCEHAPVGRMSVGSVLRICLLQPGVVIWSQNNWNNIIETATRDTGLGLHIVEISGALQKIGDIVEFTYQYTEDNKWAERNFRVMVVEKLIAES
jgi:glucoamylase